MTTGKTVSLLGIVALGLLIGVAGIAYAVVRKKLKPAPVTQPIRFNHKLHLAQGIGCKDCHRGVEQGAHATFPALRAAESPDGEGRHLFNHNLHVQDQQIDCQVCHPTAAKEAKAGLPATLKKCMKCHEGINDEKPEGRKLADLVGDPPQWDRVTAIPEQIKFAHKTHLDKGLTCAQCHQGIETSTRISKEVRVTMGTCLSCHAEKHAPTDCTACHTSIPKEVSLTCLHCHSTPKGSHPDEPKLREYAAQGTAVPWIQVNRLPGHVHFSHVAHVTFAKMDCKECHGDMKETTEPVTVSQIDRIKDMDTCMGCHEEKGVSNDCIRCHK